MKLRTRLAVSLTCGALAVVPAAGLFTVLGAVPAVAKNGGEGNGGGNGGDRGGGNGSEKGGAESAGGKSSRGGENGSDKGKGVGTSARAKPETKVNRGALASELKGLNAAHASAKAMINAAGGSQVGRIKTYVDAVTATGAAATVAEAALAELARLQGMTADQIVQEYPDPVGYDSTAYDAAVDAAEAAGDSEALAELSAMTDEQKAESFPSTWDADAAHAAAIGEATADADAAALAAEQAKTDQDEALAEAGGADLSDAALGYLHEILGLAPPEAETGESAEVN